MGAKWGGSRRPLSSPWVMINPPTSRVLTPQLLWCTCFCWPSLSRNWVPKACSGTGSGASHSCSGTCASAGHHSVQELDADCQQGVVWRTAAQEH
eukprot:scaffold113772_cov32-Tisochrysis_lutea.AAC.5